MVKFVNGRMGTFHFVLKWKKGLSEPIRQISWKTLNIFWCRWLLIMYQNDTSKIWLTSATEMRWFILSYKWLHILNRGHLSSLSSLDLVVSVSLIWGLLSSLVTGNDSINLACRQDLIPGSSRHFLQSGCRLPGLGKVNYEFMRSRHFFFMLLIFW